MIFNFIHGEIKIPQKLGVVHRPAMPVRDRFYTQGLLSSTSQHQCSFSVQNTLDLEKATNVYF